MPGIGVFNMSIDHPPIIIAAFGTTSRGTKSCGAIQDPASSGINYKRVIGSRPEIMAIFASHIRKALEVIQTLQQSLITFFH
jgi:hypothetical protein